MKSTLLTIFVSLAVITANPAVSFSINKYQTGIWPTEEGWQATFDADDNGDSSQTMLTSITNTDEGQVFVFTQMEWGDAIRHYELAYLKDAKGDIYFMDFFNLVTGHRYFYDPPLLYLDLPLSPGKTWESKSTFYDASAPDDPGREEHHRFKIEEAEIETPMGKFDTLKLLDDPETGRPIGGDYYLPGFGLVAFQSNSDGRISRMTGNHNDGWDPRLGYGEDVSIDFGWKPSMKWSVNRLSTDRKGYRDNSETVLSEQKYTISVDRMPTGLVVSIQDRVFPQLQGNSAISDPEVALLSTFSKTKSSFMVGADGQFQTSIASTSNFEDARAFISALLKSKDYSYTTITPETKQVYLNMMNAAAYDQVYQLLWEDLIETWRDNQVTIGVLYERNTTFTLYDYPDRPLDLVTLFMVTGRCPCEQGDEEFNCIEVILSGQSLPEEDGSLSLENGLRIIMEPDGMFPHYLQNSTNYWMIGDADYDDETSYLKWEYFFEAED